MLAAAMPVLEAAGDARGLARAEMVISNVHWFAGRHDELAEAAARAERHYRDCGILRRNGSRDSRRRRSTSVPSPVPRALELLRRAPRAHPGSAAQATTTTVIAALRALEGDAVDARLLLAHARSLYEEIGNERSALLTTWTRYYIEAESIVGDPRRRTSAGRSSIERLLAEGDVAHATTRRLSLLAHLLLDAGDTDAADTFVRIAPRSTRFRSDVSRSSCRAVLGRACSRARARRSTAEADGTRCRRASPRFTDALRERARAHLALAEVLQLAGQVPATREPRRRVARKLLREKGASALLKRYRAAALAPS